MGSSYFFFSDGTVQTNTTGVAPPPPAGTTLTGSSRVDVSNWHSLCAIASNTNPLFTLSRTWDVAQRDHNHFVGLGYRYEFGRIIADVSYSRSNGRTAVTYDYNPTALGLNATQVSLAGNGFPDLSFDQHIAQATAVIPLVRRVSLRLLYWYERANINDWHYDGIDQNPMPANNGAYLDVGPQSYKTHFFTALFRFDL